MLQTAYDFMYKPGDYIYRGSLLLNNATLPQKKKLSNIMLYATDKCNARCKHCYIWAKSPKQCMDMKIVKKIVSDKAVSQKTRIGLEGGEFLLHYRHENILELLTENTRLLIC